MKNANYTVGTPRSMLKPSSPWLHRHGTPPQTGNGMPNSNLKSSSLLLERYILKLAVHNRKGFSFNRPNVKLHALIYVATKRIATAESTVESLTFHTYTSSAGLPMMRPIYTQSCGKETPCGKSPSPTRVGLQALLDRLHGLPRGCERP